MSPVQKIREFIASANYRELVSIGYEIETQHDKDDREFDEDAFRDSYEVSHDEILAYAGLPYDRHWIRYLDNNCGGLADALGIDISDIIDSAMESEQENESSPYWSSNELEDLPIDGFDFGEDGSVSGWEYSTENQLEQGGVTYSDALELAEYFYDHLDDSLYVDHRCSCHVHVKVLGVNQHIGSFNLYMLLIDELSKVWSHEPCPATIRDRITRMHHHYAPRDNHTEKFNTVRIHPQGTWEFRLWGNCQSPSEVKFCIDQTISCFRIAYSRYFARDKSVVNQLKEYRKANHSNVDYSFEYSFQLVAREAMREGVALSEVLSKVSV